MTDQREINLLSDLIGFYNDARDLGKSHERAVEYANKMAGPVKSLHAALHRRKFTEFYEAALAFARAHLESDRLDLIDDCDDPDSSDARWTEACARYNETKAALVAAYLAIPSGADRAEATDATMTPATPADSRRSDETSSEADHPERAA